MKKLIYLVIAFGLVYIGLLTGCQKKSAEPSAPAVAPSTNAPAMPATNSVEKPSANEAPQNQVPQNNPPAQNDQPNRPHQVRQPEN